MTVSFFYILYLRADVHYPVKLYGSYLHLYEVIDRSFERIFVQIVTICVRVEMAVSLSANEGSNNYSRFCLPQTLLFPY